MYHTRNISSLDIFRFLQLTKNSPTSHNIEQPLHWRWMVVMLHNECRTRFKQHLGDSYITSFLDDDEYD